MAPHSGTLAWKIPWTEEPGRLQSMGSLGVGHDWEIHFHFSLSCTGEGNGKPLQCSSLENARDRGAWWAAIYGVAWSQIWLMRLSSSRKLKMGFPGSTSGKVPACQCSRCKRHGFNHWAGKIPRRRAWQSTPVFLPGKSHGQRSLAVYNL